MALEREERQRRYHVKNRQLLTAKAKNGENPCTVTSAYEMFHSQAKTCPTDGSDRNYVKRSCYSFRIKEAQHSSLYAHANETLIKLAKCNMQNLIAQKLLCTETAGRRRKSGFTYYVNNSVASPVSSINCSP